MKIAFYVEDGLEQLVFTPETEHEKRLLGLLHDGSRELTVARGEFYECRGGWKRQGYMDMARSPDESTMLVLRKRVPTTEGGQGDGRVQCRAGFSGDD